MLTVVVPVSPIPSHPSIDILTKTVESVRYHFPKAEIMLTFDGVRAQQEHRRTDYEESIQRTLTAAKGWCAVCPFIFPHHEHQTGMLRAVLDDIRTPLLLYVEQDAPLVTDEPIDWPLIVKYLESGESNLVRFSHEALILEPHQHLFHGTDLGGMMTRTSQWSQRPHLASVAYYRRIMEAHFGADVHMFIEDRMHSVVQEAFKIDNMQGWNQHRLHMYTPPGNIKRSWHSDGRAGESKYE